MSRKDKIDDLVYKALADYRRREILDLLKDGPKTTGDLCDHFRSMDRCTVMQHLSALEKGDLIVIKREGRFRWNYLNAVPIRKIYDRWINQYSSHSADILTRLKNDVEK
jgi:DNA-binding transcriptional ArsR family regulator